VGAVAERLPGPLAVSAGVFVLELLVLGVAIAAAESAIARIRLSSVRGYLGAACGVALLAHAVREVFS